MWRPKGRKSGSDEERIRTPFVGFDRCFFFRPCLFFFFFFSFLFFFFFFSVRFLVSSFRSGFRSGRRDWGAGRKKGKGREKKRERKRGQRREEGEGRIRWGDGLVLDAFGLFLFLLVWEDEGKVSRLFSCSFRIFFWVNHRFVIRSGPAS